MKIIQYLQRGIKMKIKVTKIITETLVYDTDIVTAEAKEWEWYDAIEHCKTKEDWIKWFERCGFENLPETYLSIDYDCEVKAE